MLQVLLFIKMSFNLTLTWQAQHEAYNYNYHFNQASEDIHVH